MGAVVYLNGEFLPAAEARVSVFDRGFLFGDGVYEVIPVYGGRLFRLDEHLRRLAQSLAAIRLPDPLPAARWAELLREVVERNGGGDQGLYLQVTRGASLKREHAFPTGAAPTIFAMSQPLAPVPEALLRDGVPAITVSDIRWSRCDIKAITLLPNVLMSQQAIDAGAAEAIVVRDDTVLEGASSNIFAVKAGTVITPPTGCLLLPGITRDLVLELCARNGIPVVERALPLAELRAADEIWITSSPREVLPVTRLDGAPVRTGRPGPLAARLLLLYREYKTAFRAGHAQ
jgi:D-alanine transaminase